MHEPGAQMSGHTANHADADNLGPIQRRIDYVHGAKTDRAASREARATVNDAVVATSGLRLRQALLRSLNLKAIRKGPNADDAQYAEGEWPICALPAVRCAGMDRDVAVAPTGMDDHVLGSPRRSQPLAVHRSRS